MGRLMRTVSVEVRMRVHPCTPGSGGQSTQGCAGNEQRAVSQGVGAFGQRPAPGQRQAGSSAALATTPNGTLENSDDFLVELLYCLLLITPQYPLLPQVSAITPNHKLNCIARL